MDKSDEFNLINAVVAGPVSYVFASEVHSSNEDDAPGQRARVEEAQ